MVAVLRRTEGLHKDTVEWQASWKIEDIRSEVRKNRGVEANDETSIFPEYVEVDIWGLGGRTPRRPRGEQCEAGRSSTTQAQHPRLPRHTKSKSRPPSQSKRHYWPALSHHPRHQSIRIFTLAPKTKQRSEHRSKDDKPPPCRRSGAR